MPLPTESTSLLPKRPDLYYEPPPCDNGALAEINDEDHTSKRALILQELWILLRGTMPVVSAYTLQNSFQTVSILIVGRSSPEDLSTAAFSYMFAASTGWLIGMAGTTALDTLASSTFTGSKNKFDLGILLQRSFVILTLLYIPIAILWFFSEPVFLLLGQTPRLSRDSAKFLTCLIPGGLGYVYFEIMKKYLQAQGIMRPGSYVLLITSPLSAALNYLFVHVLHGGIFTAPFAVGIGYWTSFLLLLLYCKFVTGSQHWGGWSRRCLNNTGVFLRLALMGLVQMGTELWAFEIVALAAGRLGEVSLAAQSVIMTADQVIATIPFGISVTASARLGNVLGTRNASGARRSAYTAISMGAGIGAVVLVVLMATRNHFAKIFNTDPAVVTLVAEIMPFVALFQIADGLHGASGGALRGMGRQHVGAAVNVLSYYVVGLPLGIYLAFHGWGLTGIWLGQCVALYSAGGSEMVVVLCTDWKRQVENAFERMDGHGGDDLGRLEEDVLP